MIKDKYYSEACEDAKEMAHHGYHSTDDQVEAHAEALRKLGTMQPVERPPAACRYE